MKRNLKESKLRYMQLFASSLLLSILTIGIYVYNISLTKILNEAPYDIVVANISTLDAQIYWKADPDIIHTIYYKEASDTGLFKEIEGMKSYVDVIKNERINVVSLEELRPDTKYLLRIKSENNIWDNNYSFKTKDIAQEVYIPEVVSGSTTDMTFVLIDIEGEKYMVNTQYHGTWAIDSQYKEYTVTEYANYIPKEELQTRFWDIFGSPVYAQSGANCKMNIKINNYPHPPSKAKTVDILNRWVASCKLGGYPDECYGDVYCRALKAGVDPAFAMTIWSNESGGSNYAYSSKVEDFGIHGLSSVPVANFDKQINHFLNNIAARGSGYISGCSGGSNIDMWGAKFLTGNCNNIDSGKKYMTGISEVYSWYTNTSLSWPFTVPSVSSACDYSSAYTNTTYNTCGAKGTPTTPPTTTPTNVPPGGDGIKDLMVVTGSGITPKDRNCKDPDGCICLYGYTNSNPTDTLTIKYGYTCTVDKKVILTPSSATKVCCLSDNSVSFVDEDKCSGRKIANVKETDCKEQVDRINIVKGVNFVQIPAIINIEEIPIDTARSLVSYANNSILAVGLFRNDRWEKIVKSENGILNGQDFNLEPGDVYMVISTEDIEIPLRIVKMEKTLDTSKLLGWNLVPTSLFASVASNSKSLLQNTQYSYIRQVALWNNSSSIFEYTLRDTSGEIYGESLQIQDQKGFFIKIPQ